MNESVQKKRKMKHFTNDEEIKSGRDKKYHWMQGNS